MDFEALFSISQTALELGLVNALTVLALFLSYSMLNVCDLSTDGSFTLGMAVGALVALSGHPWLSLLAAMLAGAASGFVTATLQTRMGVQSLLAGIVMNTGLYSVNMALTGNKAALNLNKTPTVFTIAKEALRDTPFARQYTLIVLLVAVALAVLFLTWFLRTKMGLAIRATGSNPDMVRSSSINPSFTTTVGLTVSNALTALSGCLMGQQQKGFEINKGSGMVTVALASLLIGGIIFSKHRPLPLRLIGAVLGAFLFRLVYALALRLNMPAFMLKAVSSLIVIIALSGAYFRGKLSYYIKRRAHGKGGPAHA